MNGYHSERLSQEGECRNEEECCILDAASEAARRVLEEINGQRNMVAGLMTAISLVTSLIVDLKMKFICHQTPRKS